MVWRSTRLHHGKIVSTNISTINSVVTASTKPGQTMPSLLREAPRRRPMLRPPAQKLAHRLCQRRQIAAQIGQGFLPPGTDFLQNAQQLHVDRAQAHPAFGIDMRSAGV